MYHVSLTVLPMWGASCTRFTPLSTALTGQCYELFWKWPGGFQTNRLICPFFSLFFDQILLWSLQRPGLPAGVEGVQGPTSGHDGVALHRRHRAQEHEQGGAAV